MSSEGSSPAPVLPADRRSLRDRVPIWWRRWGRTLRSALTAIAAWVITVAPIASQRQASLLERGFAAGALLAGVTAAVLALDHQRLARHVGLTGFTALAAASWLAVALRTGGLPPIDSYRSVLGAVAWGLFGLSWTHPWSGKPSLDQRASSKRDRLRPRHQIPRLATAVALFGVLGALVGLGLAWRVAESHRAVLAHTLAVAAALALLGTSTALATTAGRADPALRASWPRLSRPLFHAVLLLVVLAVAAAALVLSQ